MTARGSICQNQTVLSLLYSSLTLSDMDDELRDGSNELDGINIEELMSAPA